MLYLHKSVISIGANNKIICILYIYSVYIYFNMCMLTCMFNVLYLLCTFV